MADPAENAGETDLTGLPSPEELATRRMARQKEHYDLLRPAAEVKSDEDYEALAPGTRFTGPDKQVRQKPYTVASDEDYDTVPEGMQFTDPEGKTRMKPRSKGLGFTAETLYRMARTPTAREEALKTVYGDKVKRDTRGYFYVEDEDGTIRKPGSGGLSTLGANIASEAAPAAGMIGGGLAGAAGGSVVEPGGGTVGGGVGGAMLGAAAGRQFNNVILGLAGIHQSLPEQAESLGVEAASVGAGEVVGRGLAKIPAALASTSRAGAQMKQKLGGLKENLPAILEQYGITADRARQFLGTTRKMAEQASQITEGGGRVPPSVLAPEAPFLKKIEEFDAVFRAQNVFGQANEKYYNNEVKKILGDKEIGVSLEELATRATKKVSSEVAGQQALNAARRDMQQADAELENATRNLREEAARPIVQAGGPEAVTRLRQVAVEKLEAAHARAIGAAENTIQVGMKDLRDDVTESIRMADAGEDTSALNKRIAAGFQSYSAATRVRANQLYRSADAAAGDARIDTAQIADEADAFLKAVPEQVRNKYPVEIANLAKIARQEVKEGEPPPDTTLSFGELHQLRSWFRHGIDYNDMTPDMRQGSLKFFEKKINTLLHDKEAAPEIEGAVKLLDQADEFYKKNIPFLSDQMVQGTIDMLKSGAGANAEVLAKLFFDPGRTAAMRRVRGIVGENMWKGVQAARVNQMLDQSRIIGSETIDASKFAAMVEQESRDGLLATAYDERTAAKLTKLATDVRRLNGAIPITQEPGDTISTLMQKAALAKAQIEKFAEMDPIKALNTEMKRLDQQFQRASREAQRARRTEPLHFLYEDSMSALATKAADRILGSQDLIMAAANQFGRDSNEFRALQQVYASRFFQRPFGRTAKIREELGGEKGMTEEVQAMMFPGVTRKQMLQLADNMEFLFSGGGSDVGGSMAAAARVLHPEGAVPLPHFTGVTKYLMGVPGVSSAMRFALGKYFALVMDAVSHPNFINWLAGKLAGDAAARAEARAAVQNRLALGGWFGRAVGQQLGTQNAQ